MTDRELLEFAAKAAGIEGEWTNPMPSAVGNGTIRTGIGGSLWNPLTDDGDALRLAIDDAVISRLIRLQSVADSIRL